MKKIIIMLFIALLVASGITLAQNKKPTAEVLYFKANLACCKGRACNALEAKVKEIIEKNWTDGSVKFWQVKLTDTTNNELIKRYNAQSQTLVIVVTKKKKETSTDISATLHLYASNNDAVQFEKELTEKIREAIK